MPPLAACALVSRLVAFSDGKPVSTFPENALAPSMRDRAPAVHRLRMLAARLGDPADRMTGRARSFGQRDVGERDDTHQTFATVEHGQPPQFDVGHVVRHLVDVVIGKAVFHLHAHHIAHRSLRSLSGGHCAHRDVAVGDHADQPVVLTHREGAGINLRHHLRRLADSLIRIGDIDLNTHHFADLHDASPLALIPRHIERATPRLRHGSAEPGWAMRKRSIMELRAPNLARRAGERSERPARPLNECARRTLA